MTDTIKITTLSQMGTTIPGPTLVPVVDMSGVPTTKKATIANIANAILSQAGNGYAYAAKANLANVAGSASTVSAAAQPNITSVGTLTTLAVSGATTLSGATNLGPVGNVTITGGTVGQVLTTNGSNVLSWSTVASGNNDPAGSNTQVQFNDGGAFGATANLVFNKTTNNLTLAGNVIAQTGVYSNVISSIGDSNLELWINSPSGFSFVFTNGGALQLPGGHVLETDGDGEFELKSGNGIVISSDIANTNQHFSFRTDGVFHAPSNVELEGTRLSIGPGAANVDLSSPTVVINANSNVYVQAALTNENANGSADWVAYGTDGDDMGGWTDFGFTGYNFNDANYTITGPGDGYVFAHAYANGVGGGNLVLATGDHGTTNDIVFATNGFAAENEFGRISDANNSLELTRTGATITFPDSTEQSTAFTGNIAAANVTGLGNIATINLTGSNANVLYGNGVFAAVAGGANTGNVTFDDVTVQGVNGLNLSAGADFTANLAYLQVRAGDVASHIHLDTGNNDAYDLIVGDDQNYVQVSSTGNILLSSYDSNTAQYTWTLDYNGNLILAGGNSVIQSIANSSLDPLNPNVSTMVLTPDPGYSTQALVLDPTAPGHIHLRAPGANIDEPSANIFLGGEESSFEVGYYNGSAPNVYAHSGNNTWTFDNTGNLTLPSGGDILFNNGKIISADNEDFEIRVQDSNDDGYRLDLVVDDGAGNVWTRVEVERDRVQINTNLSGGNGHVWNFLNDGGFQIPGNLFVDNSFSITSNNAGNTYLWTFGDDGRLTFPGTPRIDTDSNNFEVQAAEAISLEANTVVNIYTDAGNTTYQWQFGDDGNFTIPDAIIGTGNLTLYNYDGADESQLSLSGSGVLLYSNASLDLEANTGSNVSILTDGGNREWVFDTTGTLTTPGDITVGGDITGTAGANTLILKAQPTTDTYIQLNSIVDSIISTAANFEIVTDSSNTSQSWNFDITGNLTLPGNTLAINYANGDAAFGNIVSVNLDGNVSNVLLGNGVFASIPSTTTIANGNSNVSIATANGNVTINAVGNTTMTVTGTGANVTGTLTSTGKIGYASGSTVTQITNRGNGVTINALAGTIVTTSVAMVANEIDTFSVTNSSVDPNNDIVLAQIVSPNLGTYNCIANPTGTIGGSSNGFYINIVNISGFTTSDETITIRFMVIKAPNA